MALHNYVCEWLQLSLYTMCVNDCKWLYTRCVWMTSIGSICYVCKWPQLALHPLCANDYSCLRTLCVWMTAVGYRHYVCGWLQLALHATCVNGGSCFYILFVCEWLQLALHFMCVNDCCWSYTRCVWMTAVGSTCYVCEWLQLALQLKWSLTYFSPIFNLWFSDNFNGKNVKRVNKTLVMQHIFIKPVNLLKQEVENCCDHWQVHQKFKYPNTKPYLEAIRTSTVDLFCKNYYRLWSIQKRSIVDFILGSKYASE